VAVHQHGVDAGGHGQVGEQQREPGILLGRRDDRRPGRGPGHGILKRCKALPGSGEFAGVVCEWLLGPDGFAGLGVSGSPSLG
jgi:hypothetical protein